MLSENASFGTIMIIIIKLAPKVMDGNGVVGKMPEMRISKSEIVLSIVDSFRVVDPVKVSCL